MTATAAVTVPGMAGLFLLSSRLLMDPLNDRLYLEVEW